MCESASWKTLQFTIKHAPAGEWKRDFKGRSAWFVKCFGKFSAWVVKCFGKFSAFVFHQSVATERKRWSDISSVFAPWHGESSYRKKKNQFLGSWITSTVWVGVKLQYTAIPGCTQNGKKINLVKSQYVIYLLGKWKLKGSRQRYFKVSDRQQWSGFGRSTYCKAPMASLVLEKIWKKVHWENVCWRHSEKVKGSPS